MINNMLQYCRISNELRTTKDSLPFIGSGIANYLLLPEGESLLQQ